ncbi:hypothetical protein PT974_07175 [Cladobotryum mycophilum]|uniref:Heterokaryon incompatibility domain-containing protein n=1 Tax=Cladobotryum mycophilum TaxID=491253 RepID=A0ABR0SNS0_9HYPO
MTRSDSRLCIFCRRLESTKSPCPVIQHPPVGFPQSTDALLKTVTPLSPDDEQLLESLNKQPSRLCQRCSAYDVLDVFEHAQPLYMTNHMSSAEYEEYCESKEKYEMTLDDLSSLVLEASCPLCRMLYRIFPRVRLDPKATMKLVPFRSYVRDAGWEQLPTDIGSHSAIFLGLRTATLELTTGATTGIGPNDENIRHGLMLGEAIALDSRYVFPGRTLKNAQLVAPGIDFSRVKRALRDCEDNHGSGCQPNDAAQLQTTLMLDVRSRKVIPCPPKCDYIALSYVWGGVMPASNALQSRTLPQTIEDAITVTKNLGLQYLWVDALCIDQSRNPTPKQLAAKLEQLKIMDLIYAGAIVTIVALAGSNSNAGLVGVSSTFRRVKQVQEVVNGRTLLTVPPHLTAEMDVSIWNSRAWTLQEGILAKRYLYFTSNQLHFVCHYGQLSESDDAQTIPPGTMSHSGTSLMEALTGPIASGKQGSGAPNPAPQLDTFSNTMLYTGLLSDYTSRQMTNEGDSLNAFLGVLSAFERRLFTTGFICGLPLQSHPESLAWIHGRQVTPKRRPLFPSWSWAGWQGAVVFPDMVFDQRSRRGQWDCKADLKPQILTHSESKIVAEGWFVTLQIETEPFSVAVIPGTNETMGSIIERDFLHANTIPSGSYDCFIVQRVTYKPVKDGSEKQRIFLIILDWDGQEARRRTLVSFWTFQGEDFMKLLPERKTITLI